jgi:hypothetical protein
MLADLASYVALALWCNTVAGPPFDPVFLWYAQRHPFPAAWALVGLGAACAGVGAALEAGLLRAGRGAKRPRPPRRFYWMAFLIAASPVPFTFVRAAAFAHRPHTWPYALAVAAGRVPRYAAMVALCAVLSPPAWIAPAGVALGLGMLAVAAGRRHLAARSPEAAAPR